MGRAIKVINLQGRLYVMRDSVKVLLVEWDATRLSSFRPKDDDVTLCSHSTINFVEDEICFVTQPSLLKAQA